MFLYIILGFWNSGGLGTSWMDYLVVGSHPRPDLRLPDVGYKDGGPGYTTHASMEETTAGVAAFHSPTRTSTASSSSPHMNTVCN